MLTGKRPCDEMFKDGHTLYNYARSACPNNLLDIVDSHLLPRQTMLVATGGTEQISMENQVLMMQSNKEKAITSLLSIGLACSEESPSERANMMDITRRLTKIRNAYHCGESNIN